MTKQPTETQAGGQTSAAPSGSKAASKDKALVRFLNADPNSSRYDLWFGDDKRFTNVKYSRLTPYDELAGERGEFKLRNAGQDTAEPLATNSEGLAKGKRYTAIAFHNADGKPTLMIVSDDIEAPSEGRARIRLINAAPGTKEMDLVPAGKTAPLLDKVGFNKASDYKEVDAAPVVLQVRPDGKTGSNLPVENLNLASGKSYTVVVSGGGGSPLQAIPVEDVLTRAVSM